MAMLAKQESHKIQSKSLKGGQPFVKLPSKKTAFYNALQPLGIGLGETFYRSPKESTDIGFIISEMKGIKETGESTVITTTTVSSQGAPMPEPEISDDEMHKRLIKILEDDLKEDEVVPIADRKPFQNECTDWRLLAFLECTDTAWNKPKYIWNITDFAQYRGRQVTPEEFRGAIQELKQRKVKLLTSDKEKKLKDAMVSLTSNAIGAQIKICEAEKRGFGPYKGRSFTPDEWRERRPYDCFNYESHARSNEPYLFRKSVKAYRKYETPYRYSPGMGVFVGALREIVKRNDWRRMINSCSGTRKVISNSTGKSVIRHKCLADDITYQIGDSYPIKSIEYNTRLQLWEYTIDYGYGKSVMYRGEDESEISRKIAEDDAYSTNFAKKYEEPSDINDSIISEENKTPNFASNSDKYDVGNLFNECLENKDLRNMVNRLTGKVASPTKVLKKVIPVFQLNKPPKRIKMQEVSTGRDRYVDPLVKIETTDSEHAIYCNMVRSERESVSASEGSCLSRTKEPSSIRRTDIFYAQVYKQKVINRRLLIERSVEYADSLKAARTISEIAQEVVDGDVIAASGEYSGLVVNPGHLLINPKYSGIDVEVEIFMPDGYNDLTKEEKVAWSYHFNDYLALDEEGMQLSEDSGKLEKNRKVFLPSGRIKIVKNLKEVKNKPKVHFSERCQRAAKHAWRSISMDRIIDQTHPNRKKAKKSFKKSKSFDGKDMWIPM